MICKGYKGHMVAKDPFGNERVLEVTLPDFEIGPFKDVTSRQSKLQKGFMPTLDFEAKVTLVDSVSVNSLEKRSFISEIHIPEAMILDINKDYLATLKPLLAERAATDLLDFLIGEWNPWKKDGKP